MTTLNVLELSAQIASIGAAVDAAEILATRTAYASDGVYSWALMRTNNRWSTTGLIARILDSAFNPSVFRLLMVGQLVISLLVLTRVAFPCLAIAVGALFILRVAIHVRHQIGLDGSDQMNAIVLGALTLGLIAPIGYAQNSALWFIAFQGLLAYFTSGVAKAVSPVWRSGRAIQGIMRTRSYGKARVSRVLAGATALSSALCWSVIIFECAFPFVALASPRACAIILAVGVVFHASLAMIMGLNNFVWSFIATYPAIFQASIVVNTLLHPQRTI